jgi:hypothetical protein
MRGMLWNCFQLWFEKILRILWGKNCFWNYHILFNLLVSPCIFLKLVTNTFKKNIHGILWNPSLVYGEITIKIA